MRRHTLLVTLFLVAVSHAACGAAPRAARLEAAVDSLEVRLSYQGPQDKPYYNLTLAPTPATRADAFALDAVVTREERVRLIHHLARDGFLRHAVEDTPGQASAPAGYVLRVTFTDGDGKHELREALGWDLCMLRRLDGLKSALRGDAAKAMDTLLERLTGQRAEWERQARAAFDRLRAQLSANPLWENGAFPRIDLPPSASLEQVLSQMFRSISFDAGRVEEHRILYSREMQIRGSLPDRYMAVLVATNQGRKIVLLRYTSRSVGWWSRVF